LRSWDVHPHVLTDLRELEAVQSALATFYRDRRAEYDRSTVSPDLYRDYAGLIASHAPRGARVLDLGAGGYQSPLALHRRGLGPIPVGPPRGVRRAPS